MINQPCEHCGGPTSFVTEISRLGDDPGRIVFFCDACKRSTWATIMTQQQAQQQQQGQSQKDGSEE